MELGYDNDVILAGCDVSIRTLRRMRATWKEYSEVYVANETPRGRPRILSELHGRILLDYLEQRPHTYLDELVWFL